MLTQLLFTGITLLSPRIETNFAERWFLHSFPKFAGLHERNDDTEGQAGLDIAMVSPPLYVPIIRVKPTDPISTPDMRYQTRRHHP